MTPYEPDCVVCKEVVRFYDDFVEYEDGNEAHEICHRYTSEN